MFGRTPELFRIHTYSQAVQRLESTKPIRGKDPVFHGVPWRVDRRQADVYRIRRAFEGGPVQAWMYDTPIITVHPDDRLDVEAYDSATTRKVLNHALPEPFHVSICNGKQVLHVNRSAFFISDGFTIDQKARQVLGVHRGVVRRVDRKLAKVAMRPYASNIALYKTWLGVFSNPQVAREFLRQQNRTARTVLSWCRTCRLSDLEHPDNWVHIAATDVALYGKSQYLLHQARLRVYRWNDVFRDEVLPAGKLHRDAGLGEAAHDISY